MAQVHGELTEHFLSLSGCMLHVCHSWYQYCTTGPESGRVTNWHIIRDLNLLLVNRLIVVNRAGCVTPI